jgi:hypothetical protein
MTNPTSNFGWQMPTPTDLVTDLPADFEVFGQAVDTDFADLLGGTTGQVLSKTSATDLSVYLVYSGWWWQGAASNSGLHINLNIKLNNYLCRHNANGYNYAKFRNE